MHRLQNGLYLMRFINKYCVTVDTASPHVQVSSACATGHHLSLHTVLEYVIVPSQLLAHFPEPQSYSILVLYWFKAAHGKIHLSTGWVLINWSKHSGQYSLCSGSWYAAFQASFASISQIKPKDMLHTVWCVYDKDHIMSALRIKDTSESYEASLEAGQVQVQLFIPIYMKRMTWCVKIIWVCSLSAVVCSYDLIYTCHYVILLI